MNASPSTEANDIRPVIETGSNGRWELWLFIPLLLIGGIWLFNTLTEARQATNQNSIVAPAEPGTGRITAAEPLRIPNRFDGLEPSAGPAPEPTPMPLPAMAATPPAPSPRQFGQPEIFPPPPTRELPPARLEPVTPRPQVVYEDDGTGSASAIGLTNGSRVQAGRLLRPSLTIPQGTVIPAVLETALDSTRPGGARALVQRDVRSFDGSRVLIPRGSRLYGEYRNDLRPGQKRALVQWGRLIRPDGVTIQLDSPSSDPLGRAGVKGKVDSKFWQRFGGALLQTVLDIGTGIAVNEASDGVIVALPGSTQNIGVDNQREILPTLKVRHGTSVSVFVARDLDFSSVER